MPLFLSQGYYHKYESKQERCECYHQQHLDIFLYYFFSMMPDVVEVDKLHLVESTLNSLLVCGITPPKTATRMFALFRVSKSDLMHFFGNNLVKWVKGAHSNEDYETYKLSMNNAAMKYLSE